MDERLRMNGMQGGMGGYPIRYGRSMSRRAMRRDRGMREMDMRRGDRGMPYGYDMRGGMDGHYPEAHGSTYYPIQAMGTFEGYYGMPNQEYSRRDRGMDYGYDMARGGRNNDYGYMPYPHYPPMDFGYPVGDFGETLSEKELEHWCGKLKNQLDDQEKQMFNKEMISQKARQMGLQMQGFGEKELEVATLMVYTDYKNTIGKNPDMAIKLAYDWLTDKDVAVKGAEKLAVYYDEIVEGDDN